MRGSQSLCFANFRRRRRSFNFTRNQSDLLSQLKAQEMSARLALKVVGWDKFCEVCIYVLLLACFSMPKLWIKRDDIIEIEVRLREAEK